MAGKGAPPVTVEEYARQLLAKCAAGGFGAAPSAGARALHALLRKLAEAGEREDVAVPLRVLRDEIGAADRAGDSAKVDTLFGLYEGAVELATQEARGAEGAPGASGTAPLVLEELRSRFHRLVAGETWEPQPHLKRRALLMLWGYRNAEVAWLREHPPAPAPSAEAKPAPTLAGRFFGKSASQRAPRGFETWQTTFDDLARAGGQKMLVLVKQLLCDFVGDEAKEVEVEEHGQVPDIGEATPIQPAPLEPVRRKETAATAGESQGTLSGGALIDLLSLQDSVPELQPTAAQPVAPQAAAAPQAGSAQANFFAAPAPQGGSAPANPFAAGAVGFDDAFGQEVPPPWQQGGAGQPTAGQPPAKEDETVADFFSDLNPMGSRA